MLTLTCRYNGIQYYLLVQKKKTEGVIKYHVTAITESDSRIYNTFIFTNINDVFGLMGNHTKSVPDFVEKVISMLRELT
jgi:hypothetical protein